MSLLCVAASTVLAMGLFMSIFQSDKPAMPECASNDWMWFGLCSLVSFLFMCITTAVAQFIAKSRTAEPAHEKLEPTESSPRWKKINCLIANVENLSNLAAFLLYVCDVGRADYHHCQSFWQSCTQKVDLGLNLLFLAFFLRRYYQAEKKYAYLTSCAALIDLVTIPQSLLAGVWQRTWIGMRFIRLARFHLQFSHCPKMVSCPVAGVMDITAKFTTAILIEAGFIHMFENSADLMTGAMLEHPMTYWQSIQMMVYTVSTVGSDEYRCQTTLGRVALTTFIVVGLALFYQYHSKDTCYCATKGTRCVVVNGAHTKANVDAFKAKYDGQYGTVLLLDREPVNSKFAAEFGDYFADADISFGRAC